MLLVITLKNHNKIIIDLHTHQTALFNDDFALSQIAY